MDLGIAGRRAIVCAASKGLGRGCATALAAEGVEVWITARTASVLEETAAAIRSGTGARVTAVPGDITTPDGRAAVLAACPEPDILINNAGGPPPGDFREWTIEDWTAALNANMLTAIELIRATVDGMMEREFGRGGEHHLVRGEGPHRHPGALQRRPAPGSPASWPESHARRCATM